MHGKAQHAITDRAAALLAILCTAAYEYGMRIWMLAGIAFAVSLAAERISLFIRRKPFQTDHLEAGISGVVLLMLMPPTVSVSLLIMSCIFAIIIGRQIFGGKENPVMPAAACGYCFAMLNNKLQMTLFPAEKSHLPLFQIDSDKLISGVSDAWNRTGTFSAKPMDWLLGLPNQPIGTCSAVLLVVIALVLILRRSASGWVILPLMGFTVMSSMVFDGMRHPLPAAIGAALTNQMLFSAVFLYGDPDHAPPGLAGTLSGVFSAGIIMIFTRVLYVTDAPVMLTILLSPMNIWLRYVMRITAPANTHAGSEQKGESGNHETETGGTSAMAAQPDSP